MRCFGVVAVRIRCFVEDTVVAAEAGHTVAVVAGIAAEAVAGCTAAFVAAAVAGCNFGVVLVDPDCWIDRCCGFCSRHLVLPSVVGPREHVGFPRGQV